MSECEGECECGGQESEFFGGESPHFGEFMLWHILDMVCLVDAGKSLGDEYKCDNHI